MSLTISDKVVLNRSKTIIGSKLNSLRDNSILFKILIDSFKENKINWAIVGGAPRDWLINNGFNINDIDIAVNCKHKHELNFIINYLNRKNALFNYEINKFGGLRLYSNNTVIDLWEASKTIGIKKNKFNNTNLFRSVSKSAALSIDSLVFTSKGSIYERSFFNTLYTGVLQLNHTSIDRELSIAKKAIKLCNKYDLVPDLTLQTFILKNLNIDKEVLVNAIDAYNKPFRADRFEFLDNH